MPKNRVEKLLQRLSAKSIDRDGAEVWSQRVPMQQFFRRVQVVRSPKTDRTIRCLVIPRRESAAQANELMNELANQGGWSVWTRAAENVGVIYELRSLDGRLKVPPSGLPGQPFVLNEVDEDIFIPPGWELPLLPMFRSLMPPTEPGRLHVWLPKRDDRAQYQALQEIEGEALPLIRAVKLEEWDNPAVEVLIGGSSRVEVSLRLRRTTRRRGTERAAKLVYRVESRSGQFGPALLNLLDRAEAQIEDFTYFSKVLGDGPNAVIEHYLLTDARIADDDFWPELERFELTQTLHEVGLPLFVSSETEFLPNLDGLVQGIDADDPFLKRLSEQVGLADHREGRFALVEPFGDDGHWRVLVLEQGQPLHRLLRVVLGEMNREPLRQVIDVGRVDLATDRKQYEEKWQKLGFEEGRELVEMTTNLINELRQLAEGIDHELERLGSRLGPAQQITGSASQLVTELPQELNEFARRVSRLLNQVAGPRYEWLMAIESRRQALAQVASNLQTLEQDAQQVVATVVTEANSNRQQVEALREQLAQATEALGNAEADLQQALVEGQQAAQTALNAINERAQRAELRFQDARERERRVVTEEQCVVAREQEVNAFDAQVRAREQQVASLAARVEQRRQSLESRLESAERREREANQETARLNILETVTIPETEKRKKEADRLLIEIRGRNIDHSYEVVRQQNEQVQSELKEAQEQERVLRELENQVKALVKQLQTIRREVKTLKSKSLDTTISRRQQELTGLEAELQTLQGKSARLTLLETHELPVAQSRVTQAQQRLSELQALGVEQRLAEMKPQAAQLEEKVAAAIQELAALKEQDVELQERRRELENVEVEILEVRKQRVDLEQRLQTMSEHRTELLDAIISAEAEAIRLRQLESDELPKLERQAETAQKKLNELIALGIDERCQAAAQEAQQWEQKLAEARAKVRALMVQKQRLEELQVENTMLATRLIELADYGYEDRIESTKLQAAGTREAFQTTASVLADAQAIKDKLREVAVELSKQPSLEGGEVVLEKLKETQREIDRDIVAVIETHPEKRRANVNRSVRRIEKKTAELKRHLGIEQRRGWFSFLFGGRKT
ncbi:hypothetical protein [Schlesneria sp. DSM 10557]|uniref:hypothetical protein n=1 Tax=Schlesneria sp. DSM 10557 TaxID=3044399 RepID=UPI0035A0AEB6